MAKDPAERASLAEVRATLAALKPVVSASLDRVDDAPPPEVALAPRRRRHALRLAVVAASFVALAFAGYRPSKLRAQQAAAAAKAASVATKEAVRPVTMPPSTAPAVVVPAIEPIPAAAHPATHRAKRSRRDANYLLDPFGAKPPLRRP